MYKIDNESLTYLHTIRDRRILLNAVFDIQEALNDPNHGAHYSDLWCAIQSIIDNLKKGDK